MTATGRSLPSETPARMARWTKSSREPLRGRAGFLEGAGAQDAGDLLAVEGLPLEQRARQRVKLLDVLLEDLPGAARRFHHDTVDQVLLRVVVLVVNRELLRQAEGATARDDRHLVDRVGARQNVGHERVARLVIRDRPLLGV